MVTTEGLGDLDASDAVLYTSEFTITKTNVNTVYVDLFTDFNGRPFVVDTRGFTALAVQILWNKNGGVSNHDLRIVNHADISQVLYERLNLSNGINLDASFDIPAEFITFKGQLRIQVKAG